MGRHGGATSASGFLAVCRVVLFFESRRVRRSTTVRAAVAGAPGHGVPANPLSRPVIVTVIKAQNPGPRHRARGSDSDRLESNHRELMDRLDQLRLLLFVRRTIQVKPPATMLVSPRISPAGSGTAVVVTLVERCRCR